MKGAAEDDVLLQYSYFASSTLSQNFYFLKIISSKISHLLNHSSCQNSSKPHLISRFFLIPSATFNFLLYSLSRNPNMFHSFVLSSAPFPSTETFTVLFSFSDSLTLYSFSVQLSFLYFFLSRVVYLGFPPGLYHSKISPLNSFFFSS